MGKWKVIHKPEGKLAEEIKEYLKNGGNRLAKSKNVRKALKEYYLKEEVKNDY